MVIVFLHFLENKRMIKIYKRAEYFRARQSEDERVVPINHRVAAASLLRSRKDNVIRLRVVCTALHTST